MLTKETKTSVGVWYFRALVLAGALIVAVGVYHRVKFRVLEDFDNLTLGSTDGTVLLTTGIGDIILGVFGILSVQLWKRTLFVICTTLLVMAFTGALAFFIYYATSIQGILDSSRTFATEYLVSNYGNATTGQETTSKIDKYQSDKSCCGWNVTDTAVPYHRTPWYHQARLNAASTNASVANLPDSCCIKETEKCRAEADLASARANGFAHKMDCSEKVVREINFCVMIVLTLSIVNVVLHSGSTVYSFLLTLQTIDE